MALFRKKIAENVAVAAFVDEIVKDCRADAPRWAQAFFRYRNTKESMTKDVYEVLLSDRGRQEVAFAATILEINNLTWFLMIRGPKTEKITSDIITLLQSRTEDWEDNRARLDRYVQVLMWSTSRTETVTAVKGILKNQLSAMSKKDLNPLLMDFVVDTMVHVSTGWWYRFFEDYKFGG